MARILDALRKPESRALVQPDERDAQDSPPLQLLDAADIELEEAMPFIEVGGRNRPLEASPNVLKAAPARVVPPNPKAAPAVAAQACETRPSAVVAFRPLTLRSQAVKPLRERLAADLVAFHQPDNPPATAYRTLLAGMLETAPSGRNGLWLYSGNAPATPTAAVILNLAITAVLRESLRVAVVDANAQRRDIASHLGLASVPGLAEVVAGDCSLEHALQETGIAYFHVLPAGQPHAKSPARRGGEGITAVLRQLRQRFDLVFVAGPCWDGRPEIVALSALCDALYLVVPQAESESESVSELLRIIPEYGGPLRGCVVTAA